MWFSWSIPWSALLHHYLTAWRRASSEQIAAIPQRTVYMSQPAPPDRLGSSYTYVSLAVSNVQRDKTGGVGLGTQPGPIQQTFQGCWRASPAKAI
ncbi:hypothetical protein F5X97DRAFT_240723 [Nemania serpens]|nr:hypothetical protein F5X97DRAFT_240723 [Nemania serpens]